MRKISLSFVIGVTALFSHLTLADTLTLQNGKQVKGKVLDETGDTINFQAPSGKRYKIKKAKVKNLSRDDNRGLASEMEAKPEMGTEPSGLFILRPGFQLGFSSSSLSAGSAVDYASRTGLMLGVSLELMKVYDFIYFQPEMMYEQLGATLDFLGLTTSFAYDVIRFPLLLKMRGGIRKEDKLQFVGLFGPSIAFKIHSASSTTGTLTVPGATFTSGTSSSSNTSGTVIGWEFGGGAEYTYSPKITFYANVRLDLGLSNLIANAPADASLNTRDWQFVTGVFYRL